MPLSADLVGRSYQLSETGKPDSSNYSRNYSSLSPYFWDESLTLHPHWQQQLHILEAIPDIAHYLVGVYMCLVGLTGVLGNGVLIYLFVR